MRLAHPPVTAPPRSPRPLATVVQRTADWATAWPRHRAEAWAVASQQRSRRNAMLAATRLAQRRVEIEEAAIDAERRAADSGRDLAPRAAPG